MVFFLSEDILKPNIKPNKFRNYEESNLIGYGRAGSLDVVIV